MHPSRAFAALPLFAVGLAACSTLRFDYQPSGGAMPSRRTVVAVGDVGGDRPFPDPARIRFNATIDRPEPDAPASAAAESSAPPAAAPAGKPWWQ